MRLGVISNAPHDGGYAGRVCTRELAAHSRGALDRPLAHPGELWVAVASDRARLLGAFGRPAEGAGGSSGAGGPPTWRRGSGGPEVIVGPGTVHVALALASPGAIVPCDEKRIVNRAVRPLLQALTRTGALAHYFGRDWVSVRHRPAAWVGFAHDAGTRRTLFEAFVAVSTPFVEGPRASFLEKEPTTLEEVTGRPCSPERIAEAIVEAYLKAWDLEPDALPRLGVSGAQAGDVEVPAGERPWAASVDEAIGVLGAGPDARGVFRVGGDLLASRDAVARLEAALPATADDALGALVDETLAAPGVALDGVRSLESVRDVIALARVGGR